MAKVFSLAGMPGTTGPLLSARFRERPNRFVVHCDLQGETVAAYLPNPGRLWELLLPDAPLILVRRSKASTNLPYLVLAARRNDRPVMLHTHWNNDVAAHLLERGRVPGWENARVIRREVRSGNHRFDFLLEREGKPFLLEVKSCTLFAGDLALFPDAVSLRATEHLLALAGEARRGRQAGVLFVVHTPDARFFLPDYHTDIRFARTLLQVREQIAVRAVAVRWGEDLSLAEEAQDLTLPWDSLATEARDGGNYLLVCRLPEDLNIAVGGLGEVFFRAGYYVYVGSAMRALAKRMERHLRKRKKNHWHIDVLREKTVGALALPIRSSVNREHLLAARVGSVADWEIPGFGCSDCRCSSHLFGLAESPLRRAAFIDLLLEFRTPPLGNG